MVKEIDGTRVREIEGRIVVDNDPAVEAEWNQEQAEPPEMWAGHKELTDEYQARRAEHWDKKLQAALSPPPSPRIAPAPPLADTALPEQQPRHVPDRPPIEWEDVPLPASYRPPVADTAQPEPQAETKEQRQDRRLQACIDDGLEMLTKGALLRLPDGVGRLADIEGVKRQSFSIDVKAAQKRRANAVRDGGQ